MRRWRRALASRAGVIGLLVAVLAVVGPTAPLLFAEETQPTPSEATEATPDEAAAESAEPTTPEPEITAPEPTQPEPTATAQPTTPEPTEPTPPAPAPKPAKVALKVTPGDVVDVDGNGPDAGDTIRYEFVVTNTGETPLSDFELTGPMFEGLTCPSVTLQPGEKLSCTPVTYTLTQADVDRGYVDADTKVTATSPDDQTVSDRDCPVTEIEPYVVSVGDFVWLDTDADGVQDSGEPGIRGVTLSLVGPDGRSVRNVAGDAVGPTTTDANGRYDFTRLPALPAGQHYTVRIDNGQAALSDYLPTRAGVGSRATDSSTGSAESTDLASNGASDPTLDFGFVTKPEPKKVSVGDFVWLDTDRDGVQDAGEPGIEGVRLTLVGPNGQSVVDVDGDPVGAATTNGAGAYSFDDLPALAAGQSYTVRIDNTQAALAGYAPTTAGAGGDRAADSSTGSAASGDLTDDGDRDPTLDFGFVTPAQVSVGDFVWLDTDRDGVQDTGEPGIEGVRLTLVGPNGQTVTGVNGAPVGAATTDSAGGYRFEGLPPLPAGQHYTVRIDNGQTALAGYVPTLAGQGTRATDSSTGSAESTDLTTNGASDPTLDFGFVRPSTGPAVSVGDFVWSDTDRDGVQDAGEPGIPGVTVTIVGPNGQAVTNVDGLTVGPVTTDSAGRYTFSGLPVLAAGQSYTVRIDNNQAALAGYVPTLTGQGTRATDSSTGSAQSASLTTAGASDTTLDFGFVSAPDGEGVTVGDFVWVDSNRNGVQDSGERGIPGVTVTIVGPNGQAVTDVDGQPVGPQVTDVTGRYTFTGLPTLPAGQSYTVRVDNSQTALAPYRPTVTGQGTPATDSSNGSATTGNLSQPGSSDLTIDFGFVPVGDGVAAIVLDKRAGDVVDNDNNGIDPGDTITYTFVVTNNGDRTLEDLEVIDDLVGAVTCSVTTLAPGQSITCTAAPYVIQAADIAAGTVDNTATAVAVPTPTDDDPDPAPVGDTDETSTPVDPTPDADIVLDKSVVGLTDVDANGIDAGDLITYAFEVTNVGDVTLTGVEVTDVKLGEVECTTTTLAPGESTTCTAPAYAITATDLAAGTVDNTADVVGTTPDGSTVTDDDSTTTDLTDDGPNPTPPTQPGGGDDGSDGGGSSSWYSSGGSWLPSTGGPAMLLLWVAGGALIAGGAVLTRSRRQD